MRIPKAEIVAMAVIVGLGLAIHGWATMPPVN